MTELTREKILAMEPGRELDALVAKKIFGVNNPDTRWSPSTEISAAWEVVEELNGKCAFEIGRAGDYFDPNRKWKARFGMSGWVEADTALESICKAALLAVMGE